ncbi:MAG: ATP-binding protein [Acidobacteria bacterium]|nr:ATP-binding protein [Acidobacteriota bacterium]
MTGKSTNKEWVAVEFAPSEIMIDFVSQFIESALSKLGLAPEPRRDLVNCVGDICNAVLEKGYNGDHQQGQIGIRITLSSTDRLAVEVADNAPSFDLPQRIREWTGPAAANGVFTLKSKTLAKGNRFVLAGKVRLGKVEESASGHKNS